MPTTIDGKVVPTIKELATEERAADDARAYEALRSGLAKLPFDVNTAGATRIQSWRVAVIEGQRVLGRRGAHAADYYKALHAIEICGGAPVERLAQRFLKDPATGKRIKQKEQS